MLIFSKVFSLPLSIAVQPSLVWNEPMACTRFGQCKSARQKALFLDPRAGTQNQRPKNG